MQKTQKQENLFMIVKPKQLMEHISFVDMPNPGLRKLALATLLRAMRDYRAGQKEDVLSFLNSDWYVVLIGVPVEMVIRFLESDAPIPRKCVKFRTRRKGLKYVKHSKKVPQEERDTQ